MKELLRLFLVFAKIGTFTFGGGYAMLPMLQRELVESYKWVDDNELMDYFAIGQCTPGVIAVNTATFVGYKLKKISGAIAATLGVVTPSIIIITIIALLLKNFADNEYVIHALAGIRICVVALIASAVVKLAKKSFINAYSIAVFAAVLIASVVFNVPSAILIIAVALLGAVMLPISKKRSGGERK